MVVSDLDNFINKVSKHIGLEWKFLAQELDFDETDIDAIEYQDVWNLKEQIFQMFYQWRRRDGDGATTGRLLSALKASGLEELLRILREKKIIVSTSRGNAVTIYIMAICPALCNTLIGVGITDAGVCTLACYISFWSNSVIFRPE